MTNQPSDDENKDKTRDEWLEAARAEHQRRRLKYPRGMTRDEWVQEALAARVEQGLPVAIEDDDVLDFLADVLLHAPEKKDR